MRGSYMGVPLGNLDTYGMTCTRFLHCGRHWVNSVSGKFAFLLHRLVSPAELLKDFLLHGLWYQ